MIYKLNTLIVLQCPSDGMRYVSWRGIRKCDLWEKLVGDVNFSSVEKVYDKNRKAYFAEANAKVKKIQGMLAVPSPRSLDVGAGCGFFVFSARKNGWQAEGIEPDEILAGYAMRKLGVELLRMRFEEVKELGTFDVITLWGVIEHIERPLAALRQVSVMLREGGIVALQMPTADSLYDAVAAALYRLSLGLCRTPVGLLYSANHINRFSPGTIAEALLKAGLEVCGIERAGSDPEILADTYGKWGRKLISRSIISFLDRISRLIGRSNQIRVYARKKNR
ncbi:MAG: class I SAM-dependent methyltransferase [Candidatus Tritonobacter lacicola]|nr:class I SAM-dependent methyltransferase [Candidatus Tritonobacter lacicola]